MQKVSQWLTALLLGSLLFLLLLFPASSMQGARDGLYLFGQAVLPALLPFFVLTSLLSQSGLIIRVKGLSLLPRALCRSGGHLGGAMLLCLIAGAPTSSKLIGGLYEEGALTRDEAVRLSAVCTVTGPLFLIGTVGVLLGSPALGAIIYAIQVVAALANGLLWRFYGKSGQGKPSSSNEFISPFQALPKALRDSCSSIILVGGAICVFSALRAILMDMGLFSAIEDILSHMMPRDAASSLLSGFMEVSIGCKDAATASLSLSLRMSLCCAIASFGGFSILCQSACFLQEALPMKYYFLQRISHALLAFFICRGTMAFLSPYLPVSLSISAGAPSAFPALPFITFGLCLAAGWLMRGFEVISSRR